MRFGGHFGTTLGSLGRLFDEIVGFMKCMEKNIRNTTVFRRFEGSGRDQDQPKWSWMEPLGGSGRPKWPWAGPVEGVRTAKVGLTGSAVCSELWKPPELKPKSSHL